MADESPPNRVDALIVGGGPAGLSAAICLGRACRSALVLDCPRPARSDWAQTNHNLLGFPDGITIDDLTDRGRLQAERFGAHLVTTRVHDLARDGDHLVAVTDEAAYRGHAVVLATGVTDHWPEFPGYQDYIGRSLHWCIVCDGYEMRGQRVLVVGNDAHAAEMAAQLTRFTPRVTLLTNTDRSALDEDARRLLARCRVPLVEDRLVDARAREPGLLAAVRLASGRELKVDHLFSAQGAIPNAHLARALGVTLTAGGYVKVDSEAKTNQPMVFAAGDVTRLFSHQVATAVHEGATAASSLDHALWQLDLKGTKYEARSTE